MMPRERPAPSATPPRSAAAALDDACGRLDLTSLLRRMAARDEAALTSFYHIMADRLYSMALRMLGDRGAAAEALQDVMVRVWENAARYDATRSDALTWSAMILRGLCYDRLRRRRREQHIVPCGDAPEMPTGSMEDLFFRETITLVHQAMEQLEANDRECLRAALFTPHSTADTATALGLSPGALKVRIHRATQRLRALLSPLTAP